MPVARTQKKPSSVDSSAAVVIPPNLVKYRVVRQYVTDACPPQARAQTLKVAAEMESAAEAAVGSGTTDWAIKYKILCLRYRDRDALYVAGFKNHVSVLGTPAAQDKAGSAADKAGLHRSGKGTTQIPLTAAPPVVFIRAAMKSALKFAAATADAAEAKKKNANKKTTGKSTMATSRRTRAAKKAPAAAASGKNRAFRALSKKSGSSRPK